MTLGRCWSPRERRRGNQTAGGVASRVGGRGGRRFCSIATCRKPRLPRLTPRTSRRDRPAAGHTAAAHGRLQEPESRLAATRDVPAHPHRDPHTHYRIAPSGPRGFHSRASPASLAPVGSARARARARAQSQSHSVQPCPRFLTLRLGAAPHVATSLVIAH